MRAQDDTIAAVASAAGGAGRGIVRASGWDLVSCLASCFEPDSRQSLAKIASPVRLSGAVRINSGRLLPADLMFWPDARSYTRQPVAELHTVGSPPLLGACLEALCRAGARIAEPGEFTLRAFLAGRIDLVQAEAVLGVIDAQAERQLQQSLAQLAGGLSRPLQALREELLSLLADLEAGLDFAEEDVSFLAIEELQQALGRSRERVSDLLMQIDDRTVAIGVPRVVLTGAPNVGKSSLFNRLVSLARESSFEAEALVSPESGTTRDYLTSIVNWEGFSCELVDTAGVGPVSRDAIVELAAQDVAEAQRANADLILFCLEATRLPNAWEWERLAEHSSIPCRVALTKVDLVAEEVVARLKDAILDRHPESVEIVNVSSLTGSGVKPLCREIERAVEANISSRGEVIATTAVRCREHLQSAAASLSRASKLATLPDQEELIATEIRVGLQALGTVVGAVYTDEILDHIFSRFCIGK